MALDGRRLFQEALEGASRLTHRPSASIKPSALECVRRMTCDLLQIPTRGTISPKDYINLASGHAFHRLIQDIFIDGLKETRPEWKVVSELYLSEKTCPRAGELLIRARVDLVIDKSPRPQVIEIKTLGKSGMSALRKPKPAHVEQLNMYLYLLDAEDGHLMYVNRSSPLDYRFESIEFDQDLWDTTHEKIQTALDAAMMGKLPAASPPEAVCRICPYAYQCENKGEEIDAPSTT